MTDSVEQRPIPEPPRGREANEQLRRLVRLLEGAEVLMQHARRTRDAAQAAVLRRRAERRMRDAAQLRAQLAALPAVEPRLSHRERPGRPSRRRIAFRMAEFQM
jgi:hypothetical protein